MPSLIALPLLPGRAAARLLSAAARRPPPEACPRESLRLETGNLTGHDGQQHRDGRTAPGEGPPVDSTSRDRVKLTSGQHRRAVATGKVPSRHFCRFLFLFLFFSCFWFLFHVWRMIAPQDSLSSSLDWVFIGRRRQAEENTGCCCTPPPPRVFVVV